MPQCRICSSTDLKPFLDLGMQPWCNNFVLEDNCQEYRYPLEVLFCQKCTTVQIDHTVPREVMYSDHLYLSSISKTMRNHFKKIAEKVVADFSDGSGLVVDIGSNDGTLLEAYRDLGLDVFGVEPCRTAADFAIKKGIETEVSFFDYDVSQKILETHGKAKVISAANVFYHVENLHDIVDGIKNLLADDGVFVMQGTYLPSIIESKEFDIIYHEHLLYYRIETLDYLLNMHGLELFDLDESSVHGGSIIAYASHKGARKISDDVSRYKQQEEKDGFHEFDRYDDFGKSIVKLRGEIKNFITSLVQDGKTIYAFGAPAKGTVLLNYCGLTNKEILCAVEKNALKVGRFIPNTGIPIIDEDEADEPDYYLLLAWNFAEEFCQHEDFIKGRRKFILPVPFPKILSKDIS